MQFTLLRKLEAELASADEARNTGDETNSIVYAETGPNRFNLMSLFFNDSEGVRIEEDLELNEIIVKLFDDNDEHELTEGKLYTWAIRYYKNNF